VSELSEQLVEELADALAPVVRLPPHGLAVLLPVIHRAEARALREAAAAYESDAEQPAINRLAGEVYRPGDCLSSLWLRARADAIEAGR
jgi:inorganic triphosphatase YgiF